jgi:hypothetical protein
MPSSRLWQVAVAAIAALAVTMLAAPAGGAAGKGWPMKADNAGFLIVETPHYVIKTDQGPDAAQLIAAHQEALFAELYTRLAGTKPGIITIPRASLLVVSSKEKYMSLMGPDAKGSQGQYISGKNQLAAWGSKEDMDQILETLRHEGTHQLVLSLVGGKCPVWLNEGLAEFFERAQFTGGQFQVGQAPVFLVNDLKKALEEDRFVPITKMLGMTYESWQTMVKDQSKEACTHYAEAWAMVHFLQGGDNGKYRGPFIQYIWHISRGRESEDAWKMAFGGGVAAFEKRLREYIKDLQPTGGLGCRTNMQFLGFLLVNIRSGVDPPPDMATFREWALEGKLGEWTFTAGSGVMVSTTDKDILKALFRCPDDKSKGDAPSYELLPPAQAGEPPGVRCRCHVGLVLDLTYEKDDAGKLKPKIVAKPASSVPPAKAAPAPKSPTSSTGAKKP